MTFCFGLKYKDSVYLFSDSAVTGGPSLGDTPYLTSFGEASIVGPASQVQEGALKLVRLGDDCFAAIAGDAHRAFEGIASMRPLYSSTIAIPTLLGFLAGSIDTTSEEHFEYLFARSGPNGSELWHWSTTAPARPTAIQSNAAIGSLTSWHAEMAGWTANLLRAGSIDEHRMLTTMAAVMQSFGLRDHLLTQGVGGAFCGVHVGPTGIRWLPDTNYVVHDQKLSTTELVSVFSRDGAVAVSSSFTQDNRVFLNSIDHRNPESWTNQWLASLKSCFDECAAKVWVFLGYEAFTVHIIEAETAVTDMPCCRLTIIGAGRYDLAIHPLLSQVLSYPLEDRGDGSLPARLSYVSAENCLEHAYRFLASRPTQLAP
ncbi:hypothetical protein P3W85_37280 [Cupriavidus basilensis]|uniref:Uncharacterized protein n=1 Tax=Cupriavidus basilensis TaxID=68895 RepID=A0ABT6B0Y4_9BURK|nr:hypothetical protein [Cupriavidus basilensis]MDF3838547.1 hypothetical protein [Cupriavidus basilensis]